MLVGTSMEEEKELERLSSIKYKLFKDKHSSLKGLEPVRGHADDAGLDLRTPRPYFIYPGQPVSIDLMIGFDIPKGWYGKLESKSGLNVNSSIVCCGGVIDSGYTGSIVVKLYNLGEEPYLLDTGDKAVQILFLPVSTPELVMVEEFGETERGENGFGSTGN